MKIKSKIFEEIRNGYPNNGYNTAYIENYYTSYFKLYAKTEYLSKHYINSLGLELCESPFEDPIYPDEIK